MAASTLEPSLPRTSRPRALQRATSVTTAPWWKTCRQTPGAHQLQKEVSRSASGPAEGNSPKDPGWASVHGDPTEDPPPWSPHGTIYFLVASMLITSARSHVIIASSLSNLAFLASHVG